MAKRFINFDLTKVYTSADTDVPALGERYEDGAGNEYIFLAGVASTVAGDPVIFDSAFATTRMAGTGVGPVAIALAATVASTKGWYQIYGAGSAKVVATGGVRVYGSSVTGQMTATVVTGALIHGLFTQSGNGNTVTGDLTGVRLSYPTVDRASGSY
jgi:hypothetical protein